MKNVFFYLFLTLLFTQCRFENQYSKCVNNIDLTKFKSEIAKVENQLISCGLLNGSSFDDFKTLLSTYNENEILIKECLNKLRTEGCSLNDYYRSYYCCIEYNVDSKYCLKLVELTNNKVDYSIDDLKGLLNLIGSKKWNNRYEMKGYVVFSLFFYSTNLK